jgi:lipid-binding SYLF domain-containing protein
VSLEGTSLRPDDDASAEIYGHEVTARQIVRTTSNAVPDAGRRLVDVLQRKAARNASTATR